METKIWRHYLLSVSMLADALVLAVTLGAVRIPLLTLLEILVEPLPGINIPVDWPSSFEAIIRQVRLPHAILIALTGAALAGSGAAYQGLFRNPLADPYLIGVASGAGLGAILALSLRWPVDMLGFSLVPLAAFIGAFLTVILVYNLARIHGIVPVTTLLLAGVAVGSFAAALTSFLMLRSDDQLYRAIAFLLGGSTVTGWRPVLAAIPYLALGMGALVISGHWLNVLQFGDDQALQAGLRVERAKRIVIISASLCTAVAVAFSGVIGFIGLIVPHILRMVWGLDYRHLIPLSLICGAAALLVADLLARVILAPEVIPVGIITALLGAPFFLWILRRAKREVFW
ncbi:MAG: iron chelate uptake ABC transporter family permease subunit [Anaerolineales bacterium]|nr:iron chelate uptake ABC transporter family permease subunit [Anaerolineales bacterium]